MSLLALLRSLLSRPKPADVLKMPRISSDKYGGKRGLNWISSCPKKKRVWR